MRRSEHLFLQFLVNLFICSGCSSLNCFITLHCKLETQSTLFSFRRSCGADGRVVVYDNRGPWFESHPARSRIKSSLHITYKTKKNTAGKAGQFSDKSITLCRIGFNRGLLLQCIISYNRNKFLYVTRITVPTFNDRFHYRRNV